jgi:hypothetical protein
VPPVPPPDVPPLPELPLPDEPPLELPPDTESVVEPLPELDCDDASVDWPDEPDGCCVVAHTGM